MISSLPTANGLFLQWNGVIDEFDDSGFDPLGHRWTWSGDTWRMEDDPIGPITWQGEGWVTDFHMDFSGLQQPGNQVFGAFFTVVKSGLDARWDCQTDGPSFSCFARDPIADRLNPGQEFEASAAFNTEQNPSITFNAEWTMDANQCDFLPFPPPSCDSDNDQVLGGDINLVPNGPDTWESANLLSQQITIVGDNNFIQQDFAFENGKHIKMSDETDADEFLTIHMIGVATFDTNFSFEIALTDEFGNIIPGTGPTPGLGADGVSGDFDIQHTFFRDILDQGETLIFHDVFVDIRASKFTRIDHLSVGVQAETLNLGVWLPLPTGNNVNIQTPIPNNGLNSINLGFDEVTQGGDISININETCPPGPQGFQIQGFGGTPICLGISTDATFTGNVVIMITYDDTGLTLEEEQALKLEHFNDSTMMWEDITINVDTNLNKITGTTNEFSLFAILSPISQAIGGELIPLDTTMVLVAGAQYTAAWLIPVVVSAIGIGIVIARRL